MFKECEECKGIGDCPQPDINDDGFGSYMIPEDCPKKCELEKESDDI